MAVDIGDAQGPSAPKGLQAKREAIMKAAFTVFAEQGYAATSVDDIAAATPVSKQTVYNHFGDKERLFLAVIDAQLVETLNSLRDVTLSFPAKVENPEKYLTDLARNLVAIFLSPRVASLRLLVQTESPRHPSLLALWRDRVSTPVWPALIGSFALLDHGGTLSIDDPTRAAGQFVTLVVGTVWQMTELGTFAIVPPPSLESREIDEAIRSNVGLFVRAYRSESS